MIELPFRGPRFNSGNGSIKLQFFTFQPNQAELFSNLSFGAYLNIPIAWLSH